MDKVAMYKRAEEKERPKLSKNITDVLGSGVDGAVKGALIGGGLEAGYNLYRHGLTGVPVFGLGVGALGGASTNIADKILDIMAERKAMNKVAMYKEDIVKMAEELTRDLWDGYGESAGGYRSPKHNNISVEYEAEKVMRKAWKAGHLAVDTKLDGKSLSPLDYSVNHGGLEHLSESDFKPGFGKKYIKELDRRVLGKGGKYGADKLTKSPEDEARDRRWEEANDILKTDPSKYEAEYGKLKLLSDKDMKKSQMKGSWKGTAVGAPLGALIGTGLSGLARKSKGKGALIGAGAGAFGGMMYGAHKSDKKHFQQNKEIIDNQGKFKRDFVYKKNFKS